MVRISAMTPTMHQMAMVSQPLASAGLGARSVASHTVTATGSSSTAATVATARTGRRPAVRAGTRSTTAATALEASMA